MNDLTNLISPIKCVICDVDGVLSDGYIYINEQGIESKAFHVHDGMGLKLLMHAKIEVAIITTSNNAIIEYRMKQLGIKHFFQGQTNKQIAFETLKETLNLSNHEFAYIGDDLPDLPIIKQVGFGVAVANARPLVKEAANYITSELGGHGAVREVCELILDNKQQTKQAFESYLQNE